MKPLDILIIEDLTDCSDALKRALEERVENCRVRILNPNRAVPPTFDAFFGEIESGVSKMGLVTTVVLLDQHLGTWKWKGGNLAPSLCNVISISSEEVPWAKVCFRKKQAVADGDQKAIEELIAAVKQISAPFRR